MKETIRLCLGRMDQDGCGRSTRLLRRTTESGIHGVGLPGACGLAFGCRDRPPAQFSSVFCSRTSVSASLALPALADSGILVGGLHLLEKGGPVTVQVAAQIDNGILFKHMRWRRQGKRNKRDGRHIYFRK